MKSPNKRAIIVGLFIFLGLAILISGILAIGNLHNTFIKKIEAVTIFDDVNGLQAGNNIWFSGVKIGTVKKLSFYGKSQVKIIMKIDENAQQYIRKNAKVKISTDGLIGNKILVIYGGTSDVAQIEDGDTLGIEKTISTEDMMNTFQENNQNLLSITSNFKTITQKIVDGKGTVGELLNNETLFNNLQATVLSLKKASASAEKLAISLSDYGAKLNQKGSLANDLVTDTTAFNKVKATIVQLQQIATNGNEITTNLKNDLNNNNSPVGVLLHDQQSALNVKSTFSNLDSSSQKLDEDLEALQHIFLLKGYFKKKAKAEAKKN